MYEELVKELRETAEWADRLALLMGREDGDTHAPIMRKAADAIEELSRQLDEYHSYDGFLMTHGCFVELPEPPKEET